MCLKPQIFKSNFLVSGREIYDRHFLPKEKIICQTNCIVMNNSLWTTESQSLNDFEILKFATQCLIFVDTCS